MNKLIEDIRKIFKHDEPDPWGKQEPEIEEITPEQVEQAVEEWNKPKPPKPSPISLVLQVFTVLWSIGHFAILYVMIGSPISGGILFYVMVNLGLYVKLFMLLNKERKQK